MTLQDLRALFPPGIALLDSVKVALLPDGQVQVLGPSPFRIGGMPPALTELLRGLVAGLAWPELDQLSDAPGAQQLLRELARRRLLCVRPAANDNQRQVKQVRWLAHMVSDPSAAQQKLADRRALVVGCGGTGTIVVEHLVAAGVTDFVLVDCDVVEASNFNRQFAFQVTDIGKAKEIALSDWIHARQPEAQVRTVSRRITSAQNLIDLGDGVDVIFACADTPVGSISAWIAEAARKLEITCVFGAVGIWDVAVGPLLKGEAALRHFERDMHALGAFAKNIVGNTAMSASFGPVNTMTGAWMVGEWIRHEIGVGALIDNQSVVFDMSTGGFRIESQWGRNEDV